MLAKSLALVFYITSTNRENKVQTTIVCEHQILRKKTLPLAHIFLPLQPVLDIYSLRCIIRNYFKPVANLVVICLPWSVEFHRNYSVLENDRRFFDVLKAVHGWALISQEIAIVNGPFAVFLRVSHHYVSSRLHQKWKTSTKDKHTSHNRSSIIPYETRVKYSPSNNKVN